MELINQIKETEEKLATLRIELEKQNKDKLKLKKFDYSKWIGKDGTGLAIKGKKLLKCFEDGDIFHNNHNNHLYNEKVDYEVVHMSDLSEGDLSIRDDIKYEDTELSDFKIFIRDNKRDYFCNFLKNIEGLEIIDYICYYNDFKVKRFLRD